MSEPSWWNRRRKLLLILLVAVLLGLGFGGRRAWVTYTLTQARDAIELSRFREAQSWIDRAQKMDVASLDVAMMQLRLARRAADSKSFVAALGRANRLGASSQTLQIEQWLVRAQTGNVEELQAHWVKLIDQIDETDLCESLVNGLLIRYRVEEADAIIHHWQKDAPRNPQPLIWKARTLRFNDKLTDVGICLEEALKLEPRHVVAAYMLGQIRLNQQKLDEALALFQKAAQGMEEPHPAWVRQIETLRILDRREEANAMMERVLSHKDTEAIEQAWRIVGEPQGSGFVHAAMEKGRLEALEERHAEAVPWFRQALVGEPRNIHAKVLLATSLRRIGKTLEAEQLGEEIKKSREVTVRSDALRVELQRHPQDPKPRYELGKMIFDEVSEQNGVPMLESVLIFQPDHQETLKILADYYDRQALKDSAFRELAQKYRAKIKGGLQ